MNKWQEDPGQKHNRPPYRERLTEALGRLVQLYDAWGKKDEAAKWRKELEEAKPPAKPPAKP
jgi:hypothetical protein